MPSGFSETKPEASTVRIILPVTGGTPVTDRRLIAQPPCHVGEPGGVVVQTEGGDPEPVDVMRRGRDVVLGESISAETGVNQRPAPPTPKVTIGRRFTVSPERLIGIVLYLGLERKNRDDAGHPQ